MRKPPSADPRDYTRDPPAYLDPWWVLRMRERIADFMTSSETPPWYLKGIKNAEPKNPSPFP